MGRTDKEIYRVIDNVNSYYRINSESKRELLLNKYPNAAAAYSLRLLDGYYRGPLVRVRRNDGVEVDVYPDYNNQLSLDSLVTNVPDADDTTTNPDVDEDYAFVLSLSSLGEFVGATGYSSTISATDATVCVWYDQSSTDGVANENDAKQVTALNQPKIYDSVGGVVVNENGNNSLYFDANQFYTNITSSISTIHSSFAVAQRTDFRRQIYGFGGANAYLHYEVNFWSDSLINVFSGDGSSYTGNASTAAIDVLTHLVTNIYNGSNISVDVDGSNEILVNETRTSSNFLSIAQRNASPIYFSELVLYLDDQSTNRSDIEEDINSFYQIDGYTPTPKLIDLTQDLAVENGGTIADGTPAAAYSLRLLSSTYNGPLVRIIRTIDNTEVDVYPDSDGEFSIYSTIKDGGTELTTGVTGGSTDKTTLHEFLYGQDTDCMVVVWYDQSGNGNDAEQTTTGFQRTIYDATNGVITYNGKPALYRTGTDGQLVHDIPAGTTWTSFAVAKIDALGFGMHSRVPTSPWWYIADGASSSITFGFSNVSLWINTTASTSVSRADLQNELGTNHVLISARGDLTETGTNQWRVGSGYQQNTNYNVKGYLQEVVIYNSDQSANRTGIESNINQHYNIY